MPVFIVRPRRNRGTLRALVALLLLLVTQVGAVRAALGFACVRSTAALLVEAPGVAAAAQQSDGNADAAPAAMAPVACVIGTALPASTSVMIARETIAEVRPDAQVAIRYRVFSEPPFHPPRLI